MEVEQSRTEHEPSMESEKIFSEKIIKELIVSLGNKSELLSDEIKKLLRFLDMADKDGDNDTLIRDVGSIKKGIEELSGELARVEIGLREKKFIEPLETEELKVLRKRAEEIAEKVVHLEKFEKK